MDIFIDKNDKRPIYRQVSQAILTRIQNSELLPGDKLPTVRDLAELTQLSKGTIKHAYEDLASIGAIEMTQGRGTFVAASASSKNVSGKELAMSSIDHMLNELERLGFSYHEMRAFLNVKLQDREKGDGFLKVAVVDCNPEALALIRHRLVSIQGIHVYPLLLEDVLISPDILGREYHIIVTTVKHFPELEHLVRHGQSILKIALSPSRGTIAQLAQILSIQKAGIFCASKIFANIIQNACMDINKHLGCLTIRLFDEKECLKDFLYQHDVLIVPPNYSLFCDKEVQEYLRWFTGEKKLLIPFEYQIDQGSCTYLEDKIAKELHRIYQN